MRIVDIYVWSNANGWHWRLELQYFELDSVRSHPTRQGAIKSLESAAQHCGVKHRQLMKAWRDSDE